MIYYYLSYFAQQTGAQKDAEQYGRKAAECPIKYCFPYGYFSRIVLESAIARNPKDASAFYLLGNVLGDNNPEAAVKMWETASRLYAKNPTAFRNMAFIQANIFDDMTSALDNINRAAQLDPDDPRLFYETDQFAEYAGSSVDERFARLEKSRKTVGKWDKLLIRWIRLANYFGRHDEAIEDLKNGHFYVAEGTLINPHLEWTNAFLYRGIQRFKTGEYKAALEDFEQIPSFPRNLEIVRDGKIGVAWYWIGRAHNALGENEKAQEAFAKMTDYRARLGWGGESSALVTFYKGLALQELGKGHEADELFQKLYLSGRNAMDENTPAGLDLKGVRVRNDLKQTKAEIYFAMGLGLLGKGEIEKASAMFRKTLDIHPGHLDAHRFLTDKGMARLLEQNLFIERQDKTTRGGNGNRQTAW